MTTSDPRPGPARIHIATEIYWPEETSTGHFITQIAEHLARRWRVSVLCGQPKYDRRGTRAPATETHNGVEIHRAAGTTLDRSVFAFRAVNALTITAALFLQALRRFRRGDVVMVSTNPPSLPFVITMAARLRGARSVVLLQDLYPDALLAAKMARPGSVAARLIAAANRRVYGLAERISACGRDMAALVRRRIPGTSANDKVVFIPNWGDLDVVTPAPRAENTLLRELALAERFVVQYAGNAGPVHNVEMIIAAATELAETDPDVHFLFLGSGAKWPWMTEAVSRRGLSNVTLLGPRPRSEQQVFLNACDVAVSAFVPGMCGVGVPSRMYNVMAAGRPMIAAVDRDSEQALVIQDDDIGWIIPPDDAPAMAAAIRSAKRDPVARNAMGVRARDAAVRQYERSIVLRQYEQLVEDLLVSRLKE